MRNDIYIVIKIPKLVSAFLQLHGVIDVKLENVFTKKVILIFYTQSQVKNIKNRSKI